MKLDMPVEIKTPVPSVKDAAARLGISKKRAFELAEFAESSAKKDGVFVLPGIGRLVREDRQARKSRASTTRKTIRIPARKIVKFAPKKAAKSKVAPKED
jgi:DNA-binding protein HU-beta